MSVEMDMFIDKGIHSQSKYTGLILFTVNFVCIFPMIIWSIVNYNFGTMIFLLSLLLFMGIITIALTYVMRKRTFRKIVFTDSEIRVLSNNSKLLYKIENIKVKGIKKVSLGIPTIGNHTRPMDAIVIYCTEEEIEQAPRWSDYYRNRDFLFIENRQGLEELLSRFLPQVRLLKI